MHHLFRAFARTVLFSGAVLAASIAPKISAHATGSIKQLPGAKVMPRLFASSKTKQSLGPLTDYIAGWAGMDVLVVSEDDLKRQGGYYPERPEEAFERYAATIQGFAFSRLEREGLKSRFARYVSDSSPHAFPLPARTEKEAPLCAISLPAIESFTPEQVIYSISSLDAAYAEDIPGTAREWLILLVAHELAHCRHSYDDTRAVVGLGFEREADQYALDIYRHYAPVILGARTHSSAVPQAFIALRGLAGMDSPHIIHSTSPALRYDDALPLTTDREELRAAKIQAQNAVWNMAATGVPDRDKEARRPPSPAKMYGAAKTLYERGFFDKAPLQKRYVETFLQGAERFFPLYFKVNAYAAPSVPLNKNL